MKKIKLIELSLSKEERRITDEHGNTASTWARIGVTVELTKDDDPEQAIEEMKALIQPQVDDWLLRQGGYVSEAGARLEIEQVMEDIFGPEALVVPENAPRPTAAPINGAGAVEEDEIAL